ncbi:hypothetical protein K1719_016364 [Acacia pycnantha]|nr:hypothetical protein K1719_016364 [Acacia pycnantha]
MKIIKKTIRRLCTVSGHKINLYESKSFFSRIVRFNGEISLSNKLGIGVTADPGKYLRVPLIHSSVTKETFGHITQKFKSRLSSWKGKYLTIVGQAVLIKAVISALPSYQMQSSLLPKGEWLRWKATRNPRKPCFQKWTWTKIFAHVCWLLWKARCVQLFEGRSATPKEVFHQCQHHLREEVVAGRWKHQLLAKIARTKVKWKKPNPRYVRLHVDASIREDNQVAVGGLIRDERGSWVPDFVKNIETYPMAIVEVLAIKTGLEVVFSYKNREIIECVDILAKETYAEDLQL